MNFRISPNFSAKALRAFAKLLPPCIINRKMIFVKKKMFIIHQLDDPDDESPLSKVGAPAEEVGHLATHFRCKRRFWIRLNVHWNCIPRYDQVFAFKFILIVSWHFSWLTRGYVWKCAFWLNSHENVKSQVSFKVTRSHYLSLKILDSSLTQPWRAWTE